MLIHRSHARRSAPGGKRSQIARRKVTSGLNEVQWRIAPRVPTRERYQAPLGEGFR